MWGVTFTLYILGIIMMIVWMIMLSTVSVLGDGVHRVEIDCKPLKKQKIVIGYNYHIAISVDVIELETVPRIALYATKGTRKKKKLEKRDNSIELNEKIICWVPDNTLEFSEKNIEDETFIINNMDKMIYIDYDGNEAEKYILYMNAFGWTFGGLVISAVVMTFVTLGIVGI